MIKKREQNFNLLCDSATLRLCVKNFLFIFAFIFIFSLGTFAQNNSNRKTDTQTMPADFNSDKCSLFPDCDYGDCCVEHDKIYYFGGSSKERRQADKKLYKCVRAKKGFHHRIIAPLMYVGVRIGGVSWLPTPFRWGFGKKKMKQPKNNSLPKKINKSEKII